MSPMYVNKRKTRKKCTLAVIVRQVLQGKNYLTCIHIDPLLLSACYI